jgi:hypothetical protein
MLKLLERDSKTVFSSTHSVAPSPLIWLLALNSQTIQSSLRELLPLPSMNIPRLLSPNSTVHNSKLLKLVVG